MLGEVSGILPFTQQSSPCPSANRQAIVKGASAVLMPSNDPNIYWVLAGILGEKLRMRRKVVKLGAGTSCHVMCGKCNLLQLIVT